MAVLGVGKMGMRLTIQLARSWSAFGGVPDRRLRIVLVDVAATRRKDFLLAQHPQIKEVCDLVCHDMDVRSQAFGRGAVLVEKRREPPAVVYVCFDSDELGVAAALAIRLHSGLDSRTQIVVIVEDEAGSARVLSPDGAQGLAGAYGVPVAPADKPAIVLFSLLVRTCVPELLVNQWQELVARAISNHYEWRLGRDRRLWRELSEDDKDENRDAAAYVPTLLEAIGCGMAHPRAGGKKVRDFSPAEVETITPLEHERHRKWMESRAWTYAPGPRNEERKTNPSLVPWDDLDKGRRDFTCSQIRWLPAALAQAGYVIAPKPDLPG